VIRFEDSNARTREPANARTRERYDERTMTENGIYILGAARTPIGKMMGGLATVPAVELDGLWSPWDDLARLAPAFRLNGTVTAGNAPGFTDGGAVAMAFELV
jgi:acetyl-CoA acetyltransferase